MDFRFDDIGFKDEIELMNIQKRIEQNQIHNNQVLGFNLDSLYNEIEKQNGINNK